MDYRPFNELEINHFAYLADDLVKGKRTSQLCVDRRAAEFWQRLFCKYLDWIELPYDARRSGLLSVSCGEGCVYFETAHDIFYHDYLL